MTAKIIPFNKSAIDPKCSFCGKLKSKAKAMIQSPTGKFICNTCVAKCKTLIEESKDENRNT